jgi:hypothetical protein
MRQSHNPDNHTVVVCVVTSVSDEPTSFILMAELDDMLLMVRI